MSRNSIQIAGELREKPRIITDAEEFACRVFETKVMAKRRSEKEDVLVVRFTGKEISEEEFTRMEEGQAIAVSGAIHTENEPERVPTKPSVKIFIKAKEITLIETIEKVQNEVRLRGCICKDPVIRQTPKGTHIADIIIAVTDKDNVSFIPCVCWNNIADAVERLAIRKGTYIKIGGRLQSREYRKKIQGSSHSMTAYEVSVAKMGAEIDEGRITTEETEETAAAGTK